MRTPPSHSTSANARSDGFSLIEVMVATVIAVLAVVGLAYTFGMGRGFVDRFEVERAALAVAHARLEGLSMSPTSPDLAITTPGTPHLAPFTLNGRIVGQERWFVDWIDSPADGLSGAGDWNPHDLKRVRVQVAYQQIGFPDTVTLTRLYPPS